MFNTRPHVAVTCNYNFSLLLHGCDFVPVINHNVNIVRGSGFAKEVSTHRLRTTAILCVY